VLTPIQDSHKCSIEEELLEGLTFKKEETYIFTCERHSTIEKDVKSMFVRCGYRPLGFKTKVAELKAYFIYPVGKEEKRFALLTVTLKSSPYRVFKYFLEAQLMQLQVRKARSDVVEVSEWSEPKEDLFLVLQDVLRRLKENCRYVIAQLV